MGLVRVWLVGDAESCLAPTMGPQISIGKRYDSIWSEPAEKGWDAAAA